MRQIGITTTVPVEVIIAAGARPVDLNNVFMQHPDRDSLINEAEKSGYPRQLCCWVKGIYGYVLREGISEVIAVTQGDCSNSHGLMETLEYAGVKVVPFAYPFDRDRGFLRLQMEKLMTSLGTDADQVEKTFAHLKRIRAEAHELDRMTWEENKLTGRENHRFLVSCSDFESDPEAFERKLIDAGAEAKKRNPAIPRVRLGYVGVPPIFDDLYETVEKLGAKIVFNEVQRQFALPEPGENLIDCYLHYTYPYDIFGRIKDISTQIRTRRLDGLVHYVQSFCWRGIGDQILRREVGIPVLTLEGDRPGPLDAAAANRLEAFIESLLPAAAGGTHGW